MFWPYQLLTRIIGRFGPGLGGGVCITKKYSFLALAQCYQSLTKYQSNQPFLFTSIRTFKLSSLDMSFTEEKERFLTMPLEDKRKHYVNGYLTTADLPTWEQYYKQKQSDIVKATGDAMCEANRELNLKVSVWRGDITMLEVDAVVNAANSSLLGGAGVDGAIHKAAGPNLVKECRTLKGCKVGQAKLTGGYGLPAKYLIHTVGPQDKDPNKLRSCYQESLKLLISEQLRTVAFPCISTGVYGYPQRDAAEVAISTVKKVLEEDKEQVDRVIFCVFLKADLEYYEELLQQYFPVA